LDNVGGHHLRILTQNAAVLSVANVFGRLLMIILTIVLARWVGESDYGQFSQAIAWTLVIGGVGNLGLERLITREVARAPTEAGPRIRQALALKLGVCTLSVPVLVGLNVLLGFQGQMALLLYLMGAYNILDSFRLLFSAVFEGCLRMELELWLTGAQAVGVFVLSLIALWAGQGVVGVAWAHVLAGAPSVLLGYYLLVRTVAPVGKLYQRDLWRLMSDTLPFGLYMLFTLFYYRSPAGLVGLWQGDAAAGWFNAAFIIAVNLMILPRIILGSSFPLLAYGQIAGRSSVRCLGTQTIRYLLLLGFPLAIGTRLAAPAIIQLLYGPAYAPATRVLQIVSISIPLTFLNTFFEGVLGAVDRQKQCALIRGAMLVLFIGLGRLLTHSTGYEGTAIAFVVVEAVACLVLCLTLMRDIQWKSLAPTLWKAGAASLWMAMGMWLGQASLPMELGLGAGGYALALWALRVFTPEEIAMTRALWQRVGRGRAQSAGHWPS
jgi:O-antigen/teichoic acid export membrane protein